MNRMTLLCSLIAILAVPALCDTAVPTLSVSIAILPLSEAGSVEVPKRVLHHGHDTHFHVVVSNVSDKPQRIWDEQWSEGYSALSFEVTDNSGKTWVIKKKERSWTENAFSIWTLEPHESLVLDVNFTDSNTWEDFPHSQTVTMRAIFDVMTDGQSKEYAVWTGRVLSKSDKYIFSN